MTVYPNSQLSMMVDNRVFNGIVKLAKKAGMQTSPYARDLIMAAYTAKVTPGADAEMDAAVAAVGEARAASPVSSEQSEKLEQTIVQLRSEVASKNAELRTLAEDKKTVAQAKFKLEAQLVDANARIAALEAKPAEQTITPSVRKIMETNEKKLLDQAARIEDLQHKIQQAAGEKGSLTAEKNKAERHAAKIADELEAANVEINRLKAHCTLAPGDAIEVNRQPVIGAPPVSPDSTEENIIRITVNAIMAWKARNNG